MPAFAQTKVKVTTQVNETISAVKTIKNPESKANVLNVFSRIIMVALLLSLPFISHLFLASFIDTWAMCFTCYRSFSPTGTLGSIIKFILWVSLVDLYRSQVQRVIIVLEVQGGKQNPNV